MNDRPGIEVTTGEGTMPPELRGPGPSPFVQAAARALAVAGKVAVIPWLGYALYGIFTHTGLFGRLDQLEMATLGSTVSFQFHIILAAAIGFGVMHLVAIPHHRITARVQAAAGTGAAAPDAPSEAGVAAGQAQTELWLAVLCAVVTVGSAAGAAVFWSRDAADVRYAVVDLDQPAAGAVSDGPVELRGRILEQAVGGYEETVSGSAQTFLFFAVTPTGWTRAQPVSFLIEQTHGEPSLTALGRGRGSVRGWLRTREVPAFVATQVGKAGLRLVQPTRVLTSSSGGGTWATILSIVAVVAFILTLVMLGTGWRQRRMVAQHLALQERMHGSGPPRP